jgi:hypothetical protein
METLVTVISSYMNLDHRFLKSYVDGKHEVHAWDRSKSDDSKMSAQAFI